MTHSASADVVIVGGGVIGCATTRELARDHDVLVLEAGTAGGETSPKASGLVATIPDLPAFPEASRYAMDFFHEYDGTRQFDFTPRPGVQLVASDEEQWGREHAEEMNNHGFDVSYLPGNELAARFPGALVLDDFVGGVVFEDCGWIDPHTYTMTLKADAEAADVRYETESEVDEILVENGAVAGVRVDEETIEADQVVVAAGWRTRDLLAGLVDVPVRPFRWQAVNLQVDREFAEDFPMAWDHLSRMYWRPEHNGDLHVGGGTYFVDGYGDRRSTITAAFRELVAETITRRVQDVADARIAGEDCCPSGDAATPDDRPIIDAPVEGPDGLVVAVTGPVGGIMCSPFVATAVRSLLTGDDAPFPVDPFAVDRFDDRGIDFDCYYVTNSEGP
ncbi:MAG: NAD(P)/FAD-dependent oxidoreductase [Halobacteriota archaeon]